MWMACGGGGKAGFEAASPRYSKMVGSFLFLPEQQSTICNVIGPSAIKIMFCDKGPRPTSPREDPKQHRLCEWEEGIGDSRIGIKG